MGTTRKMSQQYFCPAEYTLSHNLMARWDPNKGGNRERTETEWLVLGLGLGLGLGLELTLNLTITIHTYIHRLFIHVTPRSTEDSLKCARAYN